MMVYLIQMILPLYLASVQIDQYEIDPTNTKIEFNAKHFGVINVRGHFSKFKGTLTFNNNQLQDVNIQINVNSISTGNNGRDKSLKNDTFLGASKYPYIHFRSNDDITLTNINGFLSVKNVSNIATISYSQSNNDGITILKGECLLKRTDYNLIFGSMNDLVSNEISISMELRLTKTHKKTP